MGRPQAVAPEPQHVQRPSLDGQLLGTKSDPMCATLGPKRARHAWCARCATCSTCAKCTACSSRARRAMCGARAACARCARARDSTHRDTCRPPPSLSKTNAQSRRVAIMVSGGPAHTRPYASTPAVHVKNNLTVIAGCPRVIPFQHFVLFLQGKMFAWPTHMTQYGVPNCTLYCFFCCKGKCSQGQQI